MKQAFQIGDHIHEAWLAKRGDGLVLGVDGARVPVRRDGDGFVFDGRRLDAVAARLGDSVFVHLDGDSYEVRLLDPVRRHVSQAADGAGRSLRAPMPGLVVAVPVAAGQEVKAGDPLIVIESMKLETTITAPQGGVIEAVHYAQGQSFERSALLVSLKGA